MRKTGLQFLVVAGFACTLLGAGCATVEAPSGNALRVGVTANFPPLIYKEKGQIKGMEADLAQRLADALGRDLYFVEVPWKDQIGALEEGRTDIIMSSMSVTTMRAQRVLFSEPYLRVGQMALVRREDAGKYRNPLILVNTDAKVGIAEGTTADLFVRDKMRRAKRVSITDSEDAVQALKRKKIDIYIADAPIIWWLASRHEDDGVKGLFEPLTRESLSWGVARSNRALLDEVNALLAEWRADGSLDQSMSLWIP